jgi:hypothetical protein
MVGEKNEERKNAGGAGRPHLGGRNMSWAAQNGKNGD